MGPVKAKFLIECVQNLKRNLEEIGSKLFVRLGRPEEILPSVVRQIGASEVFCQDETDHHDIQVRIIYLRSICQENPFAALCVSK